MLQNKAKVAPGSSFLVKPETESDHEYNIFVARPSIWQQLVLGGPHAGIYCDDELVVEPKMGICSTLTQIDRSYSFEKDGHVFKIAKSHFHIYWYVFVNGLLANTDRTERQHWMRIYGTMTILGLVGILCGIGITLAIIFMQAYYLIIMYAPVLYGAVYFFVGIGGLLRYIILDTNNTFIGTYLRVN
jgi:hypothetical protein